MILINSLQRTSYNGNIIFNTINLFKLKLKTNKVLRLLCIDNFLQTINL